MSEARRVRAAYGLGCFGTDLYWHGTSFFLLFYYTDVLGLPSATAGLVFGAAMIWDGLIDPLMGLIASRTRTRWGRYRPYILLGAAPLAAAYALMFVQPFLGVPWPLAFALLAQMLFRTAYTAISIPYGSLSAAITTSADERNMLATFKVWGGALAALAVALGSQPFVALWPTPQLGWLMLALLIGAVSSAAFVVMFLRTREQPLGETPPPAFGTMLRALAENRPFLVLLAAIVAVNIATVISGKVTVYYFTYYLQRPDLTGLGLAIQVAAVLLLTPVWSWVGRRWSKRQAWLWGAGVATAGLSALYAYGGKDPAVVMTILALVQIGGAAIPITMWSLIPDTVEVGEWKTGARVEGAVFGVVTLGQKVALGVGIGLTGLLLQASDYVAGAVQAPQTLRGLHLMMTVPSMLGFAVSAAIMWFYVLDGRLHGRIVRALERRTA